MCSASAAEGRCFRSCATHPHVAVMPRVSPEGTRVRVRIWLSLHLITCADHQDLGPSERVVGFPGGHQDDAVVGFVLQVEEASERQGELGAIGHGGLE